MPAIVGRLVAAKNPIRIILFGSHARGEAREGSDLDLLVVLDAAENLRHEAIALRVAISDLGVPTDLVVATPELLRKYGDVVGYVYRPALRDGVSVYERR